MNFTIHFDNQPGHMTVKVNDKAINHLLSAKVQTLKTICAQLLP